MSSHSVSDAIFANNPKLMINNMLHTAVASAALDYSGLDQFFDSGGDNVIVSSLKTGAYVETLNSLGRIMRAMVPAINVF